MIALHELLEGGKSELQRAGCSVIRRLGFRKEFKTESATENKQPNICALGQGETAVLTLINFLLKVRAVIATRRNMGCHGGVKDHRSLRQRGTHGKPHLEKDRIEDKRLAQKTSSRRNGPVPKVSGWSHEVL